MSIAGSIAGESVYYEEPYSVPGPCRTCCIKCPCPSLLATLAFLGGVALFCVAAVLAGEESRVLFRGTNIDEEIDLWISNFAIACYVEVTVMAILALALLSISCLGTGSVRKEFMWRFRSRAMGRCQTGIFMIVACFLFLLWLGQTLVTLVPVVFFYIQRRGMCEERRRYDPEASPPQEKPCIDLKQWALGREDFNENIDGNLICDAKLDALCNSNVLLWFSLAFFAAILVTLSMVLFLVNFAANFAKLRDRFKDGFVNRKAGAYLVRSGSIRGSRHSVGPRSSLRGSRNNILRASKAKNRAAANSQAAANNHGANSTASTLRMTAYQNSALDGGSGDELYALRPLNSDILDYDREPISTLQNYYAGAPAAQPPAYGSIRGLDEELPPPPPPSLPGNGSGPQSVYSVPLQANGRAPSHASSSVSGNASGNYAASAKMNTLDYNKDVPYKRDDLYPGSSNFNLKPSNYHDSGNLAGAGEGSGSVHGSVQAGDADDGGFAGGRWGYNSHYGDERNRRPLSTFSDPEPAPSMSGASDRGPLRGFNEYFL